jgi:N-acetylglucosaminyl-diphospho-decaprenol L-rhamnosyltransferase
MLNEIEAPVVIVAFGSAGDVEACLAAVSRQRGVPKMGVLVCENGGAKAFDALIATLTKAGGPAEGPVEPASLDRDNVFARILHLRLAGSGAPLLIGQARENLGFGGGINAWMRPMMSETGWKGVWVLNPDTWPQDDAFAELIRFAEARNKGMVQSRVMFTDRVEVTASRGLRWRKLLARASGVDIFEPVSPAPDPDDIERRSDATTAVTIYVTRACIDRIGLIDESYFLYFEDFDWGIRAKAACGIGYAHDSVVPHAGGSTTGTSQSRVERSPTVVYLQNRGMVQFVRAHHPGWLPWTMILCHIYALEYLAAGSLANFKLARRGLAAGVRGETGRPDFVSNAARVEEGA